MLTVTQVNGCEACSYAHTRMALKTGFSRKGIDSFPSGSAALVAPEEAQGILSGQRYADSRRRQEDDTYDALVQEYGSEGSRAIVVPIEVMTVGNMVGISFSAFLARLRGRPYRGSSLLYEIGVQLLGLPLIPVSIVHALLRWIGRKDKIRFAGPCLSGGAAAKA